MDHFLEIQSWQILLVFTVLRASRRVSDLKTFSDNLYQRLDLYTESMGIYLLGESPGGHPRTTQMGAEDLEIVLTVSKFLQLAIPTYTAKLCGHFKSSLKIQVPLYKV
ncbi:hypothetical protein AYI69_g754 [Smittium culicis]|uniref:Uncharacterized protein n=1 Tax=Smittium culicis TaxID=133412 RepID=A0A1R1YS98_9FUNG|nr:hypothetical protein AYI69_g754 [Smittium culicis]